MKISVILPVFNAEKYLAEALDSILSQDAKDFELVVVDDGSTDKSLEILESYNAPRLKIINMPVNCGIGMARNLGLRIASGEYIAVMDADDVAMPQRLSMQSAFLDAHPGIDVVGCRTIRVKENLSSVINSPNHPTDDSEIKARLISLNGTAIVKPTAMIRREFIDSNNLNYACISLDEDHEFWIRCVEAGARFRTLEERLLYKRRHQANVSSLAKSEGSRTKLPLCKKLLGLYYPRLTMEELDALALVITGSSRISYGQARLGILGAKKALDEKRSIHGESKNMLNQLVGRSALNFQRQFNRALEAKPR